jgi:hypothetical protein
MEDVDCKIIQGIDTSFVHNTNKSGFKQVRLENYLTADSLYQPVANQTPDSIAQTAMCNHKIYIARCYTEAIDTSYSNNRSRFIFNENNKDRDKRQLSEIKIYPNPASESINIVGNENHFYQIRIYNTLGQLIQTSAFEGSFELNINHWKKGAYFIEIVDRNNEQVDIHKVIKD